MSLNKDLGDAFVLEGEDLYYFIREVPENGGFDTIYPCPVAVIAGRFRHDWVENDGTYAPPQLSLIKRIEVQQKKPEFQELCKEQKRHFG